MKPVHNCLKQFQVSSDVINVLHLSKMDVSDGAKRSDCPNNTDFLSPTQPQECKKSQLNTKFNLKKKKLKSTRGPELQEESEFLLHQLYC